MTEKEKKAGRYILVILLLLLGIKYSDSVFSTAGKVSGILTPLVMGCIIAYILNIVMAKLEDMKLFQKMKPAVRRPVGILASIGIVLAIIGIIAKIVIPELIQAISLLLKNIPIALTAAQNWLYERSEDLPQVEQWIGNLNLNWPELIKKAVTYVTSGIGEVFSSTFTVISKVGGGVVNFVIAFIFAIYILAGREKLFGQFKSILQVHLKKRTYDRVEYVVKTAHSTFTKFIVGQFMEAVILGALCTLGMLLLRLPYATMIGTLIGATALIPVVGAYVGGAVGAFMVMTVSPMKALIFLIFLVILQQLEGNLIYPKVVGSSVGLPGIWVLAAVTVGGGLGGIFGMLVGVPLTATVYRLLGADVRKRKKKMLEAEKEMQEKRSSGRKFGTKLFAAKGVGDAGTVNEIRC